MQMNLDVWVKEFSIDGDPYFPKKDYVLVSSNPNEEKMDKFINLFYTHNGSINATEDTFIIPVETYKKVLSPVFTQLMNEIKRKGGEN